LPRTGHSWPLIVSTRRLYEREFEAWQTQIAARAATKGWHLVCLEWGPRPGRWGLKLAPNSPKGWNLNQSGRRFPEEIANFETCMRTPHTEPGLSWQRVAVFERPLSQPREWQPGSEIYELDAYEDRFAEILTTVDRDWVNLSAETISEGTLIVAIDWFPSADGRRRELPVSVNYCGFTMKEIERLSGIRPVQVTRRRRYVVTPSDWYVAGKLLDIRLAVLRRRNRRLRDRPAFRDR
jgi:hypothetical protein